MEDFENIENIKNPIEDQVVVTRQFKPVKLYIYNCNHLNEYLEERTTICPERWVGCSTEVPPVECNIVGKSYAFNVKTNAWDILIDDWRGVTLYNKADSRITEAGKLKAKKQNYIQVAPPDTEKKYIWNEQNNQWQEYVEQFNPQKIIKGYEDAIQQYIDQTAQARGYDNGYTCASYFEDVNPRYASDAKRFKDWRSQVWTTANEILNNYLSNPQTPTELPSIESIISNFPVIEWEEI